MRDISRLRELREKDKKALQILAEQSDRAESEHKKRMQELQRAKTELAESILTWDTMISQLEVLNAS